MGVTNYALYKQIFDLYKCWTHHLRIGVGDQMQIYPSLLFLFLQHFFFISPLFIPFDETILS